MDFVDEENVVLLQIGQQRGQIFWLFEHRARGLAQVHAQLVGNDVAQSGFAQTGRTEQQHVVQRLVALFGSADEDFQLLAHLGLAHILVEELGAQGAFDGLFAVRHRRGRHYAGRRRRGNSKIVGLNAHSSGLSKQKKQDTQTGCPL